jgi:hypothetical protein
MASTGDYAKLLINRHLKIRILYRSRIHRALKENREKENLAIVSTSQLGKALIMKEGVLKYLYRQRIFCRKTMQSGTLVLNANFYLKNMKRVLMMLPNSYPLNRYTN